MPSWWCRVGEHVWVSVNAAGYAEAHERAADPKAWLDVFATSKTLSPADAALIASRPS